MNLTDFLNARLDEDEAAAQAAASAHQKEPGLTPCPDSDSWKHRYDDHENTDVTDTAGHTIVPETSSSRLAWIRIHIARHEPARVMRDVEAKQRILKEWQEAVDRTDEHGRPAHMFDPVLSMLVKSHRQWIEYLALAYADHPDYLEATGQ